MPYPTDFKKRQTLGQFLTIPKLADFMASLLTMSASEVRLLDAGAGKGALSLASLKRWAASQKVGAKIHVTGIEVDHVFSLALKKNLRRARIEFSKQGVSVECSVKTEDFISTAVTALADNNNRGPSWRFTSAIINPPYGKISANSVTRLSLRRVGIEATNTYVAFMALCVELLDCGGELVAIVPRSFCNGLYFKHFRSRFLSSVSLRRIHLIDSRTEAFKRDGVLQENIIIHAVKAKRKLKYLKISSSAGVPDGTEQVIRRRYDDVIREHDPEKFIHLATTSSKHEIRRRLEKLTCSLSSLGVHVSTGKVVAFRSKQFLVNRLDESSAPLIHPCHLRNGGIDWPKRSGNKANAIRVEHATEKLLVPNDVYVLVKRFTTKEEPRRLVASVFNPSNFNAKKVGFENHLNFLHFQGSGISLTLAMALVAFLNTSILDEYFRLFNGLTQVNATDLRQLPYPTLSQLEEISGQLGGNLPPQVHLDEIVNKVIGV